MLLCVFLRKVPNYQHILRVYVLCYKLIRLWGMSLCGSVVQDLCHAKHLLYNWATPTAFQVLWYKMRQKSMLTTIWQILLESMVRDWLGELERKHVYFWNCVCASKVSVTVLVWGHAKMILIFHLWSVRDYTTGLECLRDPTFRGYWENQTWVF